MAFRMEHLRYVLGREPERRTSLAAAVERRSRMLAAISGLSPYVYDALTVLAGSGVSPRQVHEDPLSVQKNKQGVGTLPKLSRPGIKRRKGRNKGGFGGDVVTHLPGCAIPAISKAAKPMQKSRNARNATRARRITDYLSLALILRPSQSPLKTKRQHKSARR